MKARANLESEMRKRALDGFAHFGVEAVLHGKKVESTMRPELRSAKLAQVLFKYHLTPRQHLQLSRILIDVANGKKVLYVAPHPAGAATVFKAAKEMLAIMNLPAKHLKKYDTR